MLTPWTPLKVLSNGRPCHGGSGAWALPDGRPGDWMPPIHDPRPCERGYHLCVGIKSLLAWLGPEIYLADWRGEIAIADDKVAVSEARLIARVETWTERTARLFACDCAERVAHGDEETLRTTIDVARRYARGEATAQELSAARSAAGSAAGSAWSAAGSARSAARSAAESAAWNAAWSAERAWQAERLRQYLAGEAA